MKKHFRVIFSDFGRISCNFRLDIRVLAKNVRSRETRKNQGNLEAAVKGNSHGGLAGMCMVSRQMQFCEWTLEDTYTLTLTRLSCHSYWLGPHTVTSDLFTSILARILEQWSVRHGR